MRMPLSSLAVTARDRSLHKLLDLPGEPRPYVREKDIPVPMIDGVVLLADRYQPADASGPLPVVMVRCPYGRRGLVAALTVLPLAMSGFQVLIQSTRGTFGSGGEFRPFCHEAEDGAATLAWVREQRWCDGRVATAGASYLGHTQWAVVPFAEPPVEAACLDVTAARLTSAFYTGGVPNLRNALGWAQLIGRQERTVLPAVVPTPRTVLRLRKAVRSRPLQAADVTVAGAQVLFWRDFCEHSLPGDSHWTQADHQDADVAAMPPVSMVSGWWDLFAAEQFDDFVRLQNAGKQVQLTVGPWMHGDPGQVAEIAKASVRWLGRHLDATDGEGDDNSEAGDRAPLRLYLQGAGRWLNLDRWPPSGSTDTTLYLRPHGSLADRPLPVGAGPTVFTYDPADPTPSVGGPLLSRPGGQADNGKIEARPDVVTFTGPPLFDPLDIVGEVRATVHVRADRPYADVFVRLCDVDEHDVSRNVVDGIRTLAPNGLTAGADGVSDVAVRLFPTAYRVPAGHRLRVQVAAGAFPRYRTNPGTGESFATATSGVPCRIEVLHDAAHPSRVVVPVFRG